MPTTSCPTCKKSSIKEFFPFCSKRCSQVDLNRWLGERYHIDTNQQNDEH
jgi:endogenous inhibitor of DNA gyrase (YacG/DUF329 family)